MKKGVLVLGTQTGRMSWHLQKWYDGLTRYDGQTRCVGQTKYDGQTRYDGRTKYDGQTRYDSPTRCNGWMQEYSCVFLDRHSHWYS